MENTTTNLSQEPQNPKKENNNKNKKILTIVSAALAVLIIIGAVLYFTLNKKQDKKPLNNGLIKDSLTLSDTLNKATIHSSKITSRADEYDEEGEPYTESYIVQKGANLKASNGNSVLLNFGDKVYTDDARSNEKTAVVYLNYPKDKNKETAYYIDASYVISGYQFQEYKNNFSLPPFNDLDNKTKRIILDSDYSNGTNYSISQNANRAKSTFCTGDFDGDGIKDTAVIMDNNEKQYSRLLIICSNAATRDKYIGFAENYSDKMQIHTFKKGDLISMGNNTLTNAPSDGVLLKGEDVKLAILYDSNNQKFKTYYQE